MSLTHCVLIIMPIMKLIGIIYNNKVSSVLLNRITCVTLMKNKSLRAFMAKKTLDLSMVVAALRSFPAEGPAPSQRALQARISEQFGVSPSFSTLQQYLDGSVPVIESLMGEFSHAANKTEKTSGSETTPSEAFDFPSVDQRAVAELETISLKSKLELLTQQNEQLKALLQELSADYQALQQEYISRFQSMSKDFVELGEKSISEIQQVLMQSRADRLAADEQWKGLRSFLYQEVDRIRTSQSGKEEILKRQVSDLETRLYAETQIKNKWYERFTELRMRYEPNESSMDMSDES